MWWMLRRRLRKDKYIGRTCYEEERGELLGEEGAGPAGGGRRPRGGLQRRRP